MRTYLLRRLPVTPSSVPPSSLYNIINPAHLLSFGSTLLLITAVLIEQLVLSDFLFSQDKQEKQEKQKIFPKLGNLTEGKLSGTFCIPTFARKKKENLAIKKKARKTYRPYYVYMKF